MKRSVAVFAHVVLALALSACSTWGGMKEDVNRVFRPTTQQQVAKASASAPQSSVQQAPVAQDHSTHVKCTMPDQKGCVEYKMLVVSKSAHPLFADIERPWQSFGSRSMEVRAYRVQQLPIEAKKAFLAGALKVPAGNSVLIYAWGADATVPIANMAAWQRMPDGKVSPARFERVTNPPFVNIDQSVHPLGEPIVFRVWATEGEPSLQVPATFLGPKPVSFVCLEKETIYPGLVPKTTQGNETADERRKRRLGHWVTDAYWNTMVRPKARTGLQFVFVVL